MPITPEEIKSAYGKSPVDEDFNKAQKTIQKYDMLKKSLTGLSQHVFGNIYGDQEEWNPAGVVGAIGKYSELIRSTLDDKKGIINSDPLLGPKLLDYLAHASLASVAQKNAALPWIEHIKNSAVYGKAQSEMAAERAGVLGEQISALENLEKELHGINAD